NPLTVF
ncbi:Ribosomal RNA small subunit methyltransferase I, partial [Haemophilus influenzae]